MTCKKGKVLLMGYETVEEKCKGVNGLGEFLNQNATIQAGIPIWVEGYLHHGFTRVEGNLLQGWINSA